MRLILFFFLFLLPMVSGMEIIEADNFVIVKNNYETNISYSIVSLENLISEFVLEPNQSMKLDKNDFEIIESLSDNLVTSAKIGKEIEPETEYRGLIIISAILVLSILAYFHKPIFKLLID